MAAQQYVETIIDSKTAYVPAREAFYQGVSQLVCMASIEPETATTSAHRPSSVSATPSESYDTTVTATVTAGHSTSTESARNHVWAGPTIFEADKPNKGSKLRAGIIAVTLAAFLTATLMA